MLTCKLTRNSPMTAGIGAWSTNSPSRADEVSPNQALSKRSASNIPTIQPRGASIMKTTLPPVIPKCLINLATASEFGVQPMDILGTIRKQRVCDARQAAIYIAHVSGYSVIEMVNYFHKTQWAIREAIQTAKDKMDTEPKYYAHVFAICKRLMQESCNIPARPLHRHD